MIYMANSRYKTIAEDFINDKLEIDLDDIECAIIRYGNDNFLGYIYYIMKSYSTDMVGLSKTDYPVSRGLINEVKKQEPNILEFVVDREINIAMILITN